jgi:hypothetical protein
MSINCTRIKKEFFNCVKSHNLNFDTDMLKFKAAKLENTEKFNIPEEIMKTCNSQKLAKCLELKYEIMKINDKELAEYYNEKFHSLKNKKEETETKNIPTNYK